MRYIQRAAWATLLTAFLLSAWLLLMPAVFGGQLTYAITTGNSMHPLLHAGDFAVLRESGSAQVGDIVGYHGSRLNEVIIHRIVDVEAGRLILQGDNNYWLDPDRPEVDSIVGSLWFRIPNVGRYIQIIGIPWVAALAAGAIVGAAMLSWTMPRKRRQPKDTPSATSHQALGRSWVSGLASPLGMTLAGIAAVVATALAILAIVAFVAEPTKAVPDTLAFQHHGTFTYWANEPGDVFDEGLTTGSPIYVNITPVVDYSFTYHLHSEHGHDISGVISVVGVISDATGWRRSVSLVEPTPFEGSEATVTWQLDLPPMMQGLAGIEQLTGSVPNRYSAALVATVDIAGSVDGIPVDSRFAPNLEFRATPDRLYIETPMSRILEGLNPDLANIDPFETIVSSSVARQETVPNELRLGLLAASVTHVRWVATTAALLLSVAVAMQLTLVLRARRRSPLFAILADHGSSIVALRNASASAPSPKVSSGVLQAPSPSGEGPSTQASDQRSVTFVPVRSFHDLQKVATQAGKPILWEAGALSQTFEVRDGSVVYVYVLAESAPSPDVGSLA